MYTDFSTTFNYHKNYSVKITSEWLGFPVVWRPS